MHLCCSFYLFPFCSPFHRYKPVTVRNVQITEGKATELNFTLVPAGDVGSTAITTESTHGLGTTFSPSESPESPVVPSTGSTSLPPERAPIQPQDFRHHGYADMEVFLRKYRSDFPSITYLYTVGQSVQGHELYVMVISDNPREHEPGTMSKRLARFVHFPCIHTFSLNGR